MLKPGDIVLVGKDKFFAGLMNILQEDEVEWGHTAIVGPDNTIYSLETKMTLIDIDTYLAKKKYYEIHRYKFMTPEKQRYMVKAMRRFEKLSYGWSRLFLFLLNHIFRTKTFTNLSSDKRVQVCSSFVSWLYYSAFKIKFNGQVWNNVDPDDIDDHCSNAQDWFLVKRVV